MQNKQRHQLSKYNISKKKPQTVLDTVAVSGNSGTHFCVSHNAPDVLKLFKMCNNIEAS